MAELDLYGDLYGDVDDVGSPVALSPSQQAPATSEVASTNKPEPGPPTPNPAPVEPDSANTNPNGSQPTTFSISTYEDPSYPKKKHNPTNQSDPTHPPRPSNDTSPSNHPGAAGKAGVWGVKPSDMPDEGLVLPFTLLRLSLSILAFPVARFSSSFFLSPSPKPFIICLRSPFA